MSRPIIHPRDLNLALCKIFGVDPVGVRSFTLHCESDAVPTVTVTKIIRGKVPDVTETKRFILTEIGNQQLTSGEALPGPVRVVLDE